ncbi:MAG: class I adenylate-forming enzyme family protein [Bacteroidales bacterium]
MIIVRELIRNALSKPEKTAIIAGGEEFSYDWLARRVVATARYLNAQSIKKGDRVMFGAVKSVDFALMYFGAHAAGAVAQPVNMKLSLKNLEYIYEQSQPAIFWYPNEDVLPQFSSQRFNVSLLEEYMPDDYSGFEVNVDKKDTADLLFTTGTTSNPKGVELSHLNITAGAVNTNEFIGNTAEDREIIPLPLFHAFGLRRLRTNMMLGASVVMIDGFVRPDLIFEGFTKWKATGMCMVPAGYGVIRKLTGDKLGEFKEQLKYIEFGSSPMNLEDKKQISKLLPKTRICMHYGLTEAAANIFIEFHESFEKLHALGQPSPNITIRIGDEKGNPLPVGEEGEILVNGDVLMKGYWNDTKRTADVFVQGWLRTGDIGYMDGEGYVFMKGRKDDIINIGGKKVSPQQVEEALNRLPQVEESACVGIDDPSGIRGRVIKAFVVKKGKDELDIMKLRNDLRKTLEAYKVPEIVKEVKRLPRTASGKLQREKLRR